MCGPIHSPDISPRDIVDQRGVNMLLRELEQSKNTLEPRDAEVFNQTLEKLNENLDQLRESVDYITKDQGRNFREMSPENIGLIIDVVANNPDEAARLRRSLANGETDIVNDAIAQAAQNDPEKLIEIAEIMLMDESIPAHLKQIIRETLQEINEDLEVFQGLGEKYYLVIPSSPYGSEPPETRRELAREVSKYRLRESVWGEPVEQASDEIEKPIKYDTDLREVDRKVAIAEIKEELAENKLAQGDLRQKLLLLGASDQDEYRRLMRELVNLVGDECVLKETVEAYSSGL